MFDKINSHVSRCGSFSSADLEILNTLLEPRSYPKKSMLLQEGDICNFEAYIIKGCVRSYYIDENGFELTMQFAVEDWWVSDVSSFHEHVPSNMFIETLEDCQLLILNPGTKELLLQQVPGFERFFRILIQRHMTVVQNRLYQTIAWPAQQRYVEFLKLYPEIPQRVAQHYIASYLGISPEFLSKIRTKMANTRKIK